MGRTQLIVLSQPRSRNIVALEEAVQRCLEAAPIDVIDALVLTKNDNDAIDLVTVGDFGHPDRAWRGLLATALFGNDVAGIAPWAMPDPPDEPDPAIDLTEAHLLEISDRIPRNSSSLLVLIEHRWMDELSDKHLAPGRLVANGWISIGALSTMGRAQPQRRSS